MPFALSTERNQDALTLLLIRKINTVLQEGMLHRILNGLSVTATDPISKTVDISAGRGIAFGDLYELAEGVSVEIPLESDVNQYFIHLFQDRITIDKSEDDTKLLIAKIVVPEPGMSDAIRNRSDGSIDAYIVQFKDVRFYGDDYGKFEENSLEYLRDNIGDILADNLIGNIRLSENLKIINTAGTLQLNSNSVQIFDFDGNLNSEFNGHGMFFFREDGAEIAKFSTDGAYIGNISLTPTTIESRNYVANNTGFQIRDNGDAEFNNIRLRGTLYTSTIAENIYIAPGIKFIGDLEFTGDVCLYVNKHLIFDCDEGDDTYITYNSTTDYLEFWVDGNKRLEM